jgi:NADH:ubiquinone oxidoreductase subunit E
MVDVQICQGTTCYVMGGGQLADWAMHLPQELKSKVRVSGSHCLGLCAQGDLSQPPYAKIDGEVIAAATPEKVLAAIQKRLAKAN